jgi:sodium transport system permease protein
MRAAWSVYVKELLDALRDRRTLLTVLLSSVAVGPLVLMLLSTMVSGIEKRSEERVVKVLGLEHAPTLVNYLQRQTLVVEAAGADFEAQLKANKLPYPVVVVAKDFEPLLAAGEVPTVEVVSNASNQRAESGVRRVTQALRGFSQEQAMLRLAARGTHPGVLEVMDVQDRDLADPRGRAMQFSSMLPFFVMMAVLYGSMTAALDTTAGERERGSLEPLLMSPATRTALVLGKWGAVASLGMLIALLSCLSFLPGQWLLRSETLAALFQFGWYEASHFLLILAPLAAAAAALMMAVAIRTKTFKEAQANNTVVMMVVSMIPAVMLFNQEGESPWHLMVPTLGQVTLMNRVLKGELISSADGVMAAAACVVVTVVCLGYVTRTLREAAVR